MLSKEEFNTKLKEKENSVSELIRIEEDKLANKKLALEQNNNLLLEEKDKEISILVKKLSILEDSKINLEKQLEVSKTQEHNINELKKSIEEKNKVIDDNNSMIEQLNSMMILSKEEFNKELKEKEDKFEKYIKTQEDKLMNANQVMEQNTTITLNEKNKEISNLMEKLNILEETKLNLEKQLEISKSQEHIITELKKSIEEKNTAINDNNLKIEHLNNIISQTKEDFTVQFKEKENEFDKLVNTEKEKLISEKIEFESRLKTYLDEKDKTIEKLKIQLQEFVENNTEKELMLKLDSVTSELEKEKIRSSSLEKIKSEFDKMVMDHKIEFEQLKDSKTNTIANMAKTIEEQKTQNTELLSKIKTIEEQSDDNKSLVQKQIDELKINCSTLQTTINEKNQEIEDLKIQISQNLKTPSLNSNEELNQLKALM